MPVARHHRVAEGGHPPPAPTERSVRISRTTLFRNRFTAFCCYSFESRCHDWRIFSLHRRPYPPFEWSPCFPRTIRFLPAASPCDRLSRSRSTINRFDFRQTLGSSSSCRLVGPYKQSLSLTDLPCSHEILRLHAGGTYPGSTPEYSPSRTLEFCLPHRETRSAAPTRIDFGAISSVHLRSGLQPPCLRFAMTVAGHHARLGTQLLARLYHGRHFRRLNLMRLQGATPSEPSRQYSPILCAAAHNVSKKTTAT